jgi:hypothetical protein
MSHGRRRKTGGTSMSGLRHHKPDPRVAEREQATYQYGQKQAYAKQLLVHYFTPAIKGPGYDRYLQSDCQSEVEGIVDVIIEAAALKIKAEALGAKGG